MPRRQRRSEEWSSDDYSSADSRLSFDYSSDIYSSDEENPRRRGRPHPSQRDHQAAFYENEENQNYPNQKRKRGCGTGVIVAIVIGALILALVGWTFIGWIKIGQVTDEEGKNLLGWGDAIKGPLLDANKAAAAAKKRRVDPNVEDPNKPDPNKTDPNVEEDPKKPDPNKPDPNKPIVRSYINWLHIV